ncbi:putative ATP-dependent DNA helicase Q1 [Taenia solium]
MADLIDEESRLKSELSSLNKRIEALVHQRELLQTEYEQVAHRLSLARLNSAKTSDLFAEYSDQRVFLWTSELERVRRELFHIPEFRPLQLSAINAFLDNRDVILVMPTGAGKSLVYQLPSFLEIPEYAGKFTLVISPLVSLMADQAIGLRRLGIPESSVAILDASSPSLEQQKVLHAIGGEEKNKPLMGRDLRVLFVTPEKLSKSKRLMYRLEKAYKRGSLARIAIDEVHCVSQWGHDFRPDYKFLHVLRSQFPRAPILGLTATASAEVILDIQKMLGLRQHCCLVLRSSYNRSNLRYEVRFQSGPVTSSYGTIYDLLNSEFSGQSGIIYCLSQKDTESLSTFLNGEGIIAAFYHANVDPSRRERDHVAWLDGKIQVMVATVAFGMGINKPDVRFVLHLSPSKSVENYYQESGRAGRDGAPSRVVLLWRLADLFRLGTMVFAEQTGLRKLLQMTAYVVETKRCRRCLISEALGDTDWCADRCELSPCDICSNSSPSTGSTAYEMDATGIISRMQVILEDMRLKSQRLTGAKLVDLLVKDAGVADALAEALVARLSRRQQTCVCEYLVAWCLCHEVVTLDFHFTPYSTIAYVVSTAVSSPMPAKRGRDRVESALLLPPLSLTLTDSPHMRMTVQSVQASACNLIGLT